MRRLRPLLWILLATPLALAALLLAAALWLRSDAGLDWLRATLEEQISTPGELEARIEELSGDPFAELRLQGLRLSDPEGEWLHLDEARLSWRPSALLSRRLEIEGLEFGRLSILRLPAASEASGEETAGFALPAPPLAFRVARFSLDELNLGEPVLGQAARFRLEGRLAGEESGLLTSYLDLRRLDGDLRVKADSSYRLADGVFRLEAEASEGAGGLVASLAGEPELPALSLSLKGEAPLSDWRGDLAAKLEGQATLMGQISLKPGEPLRLGFQGSLDLPILSGGPAAALLPGKQTLALALALEEGERLGVEKLTLSGAVLEAALSGRIDLVRLQSELLGQATLLNPAAISSLAPDIAIAGLTLDIRQSGSLEKPEIFYTAELSGLSVRDGPTAALARLDGRLQAGKDLAIGGRLETEGFGYPGEELAARLAGPSPAADFELRLSQDLDLLEVVRLEASGGVLAASVAGALTLAEGGADLGLEARITDLSALSDIAGQPIAGSASLAGHLRGALDGSRLAGPISLEVSRLQMPEQPEAAPLLGENASLFGDLAYSQETGLSLENLILDAQNLNARGNIALASDLQALTGRYEVTVPDIAALAANAGAALSGGLALSGDLGGSLAEPQSRFSAKAAGLAAEGALALPAGAVLPLGDARIRLEDPRPLGGLAGIPGLQAEGDLSLKLGGQPQAPRLEASGELRGLALGNGQRIEALRLEARLADLLTLPQGTARLALSGAALGDANIEAAEVSAEGSLKQASVAGEAQGSLLLAGEAKAVSLALAGSLSGIADGAPALQADSGDIILASHRLSLLQPLVLRSGSTGLALSAPQLAVDDGEASFAFEQGRRLDIAFKNIPLSLLDLVQTESAISGRLDGTAKLAGRPLASGEISLSARDLRLSGEERLQSLQLDLAGRLQGERLALTGSATGFAEQPLTAEASLPFVLDLSAPSLAISKNGALEGAARWSGQLAPLAEIFGPANQRIEGLADLDARLSGSLAAPRLSGGLSLMEGRYENLEQGTLLRAVNAQASFTGEELRLEGLTADDGGAGRLSAAGNVILDPERGFPLAMTARLERMDLVERDELKATLSGEIAISESLADPLLSGSLTSDRVEVSIASDLPPEVVDLEVIDRNAPPPTSETETRPPLLADMRLDLKVSLPQEVFVRGRGLDSEWAGAFDVGGNLSAPVVSGSLRVVRGQMTIVGKIFKLTQGTIRLPARPGAPPVLDLTAVYKAEDLEVTARIFGPSDAIEVSLSSSPPLPQDEILARVLFNKSGHQLTALEALQLASAAAQLSGKGGGVGLLDTARQLLGVDVLRVEGGDETTGPSVQAGAYVSEELFLGVEQGADPRSGGLSVELEITPNISVESHLKQTGSSNLGVLFEWDY